MILNEYLENYIQKLNESNQNSSVQYFNTEKTNIFDYDDLLENGSTNDGLSYEIKNIPAEDYFKLCAREFKITLDELKKQRLVEDKYRIDSIIDSIKQGHKLYLPVLDFSKEYFYQEGLHRIGAAATLNGWDTLVPTLIVYDSELENPTNIDYSEHEDYYSQYIPNSKLIFSERFNPWKVYQYNDDIFLFTDSYENYVLNTASGDLLQSCDESKQDIIYLFNETKLYPAMHAIPGGISSSGLFGDIYNKYDDFYREVTDLRRSIENDTLYIKYETCVFDPSENIFYDSEDLYGLVAKNIDFSPIYNNTEFYIDFDCIQPTSITTSDKNIKIYEATNKGYDKLTTLNLGDNTEIDVTYLLDFNRKQILNIYVKENSNTYNYLIDYLLGDYDEDDPNIPNTLDEINKIAAQQWTAKIILK